MRKSFVGWVGFCLLVVAYNEAVSAQPQVEIFHIPQTHMIPTGLYSKSSIERVAFSQHQVAQTILQHGSAIVVDEGGRNLQASDRLESRKKEVDLAHAIFPNGFPKTYEELDPSQRSFIAYHGAASTLFFLGELNEVIPDIPEEELKRIDEEIDARFAEGNTYFSPPIRELIMDRRELATLRHIASLRQSAASSGRDILLVYGAAHDFSRHQSEFPELSIHRSELPPIPEDEFFFSKLSSPEWNRLTGIPTLRENGNPVAALFEYRSYYDHFDSYAARVEAVYQQQKAIQQIREKEMPVILGAWRKIIEPQDQLDTFHLVPMIEYMSSPADLEAMLLKMKWNIKFTEQGVDSEVELTKYLIRAVGDQILQRFAALRSEPDSEEKFQKMDRFIEGMGIAFDRLTAAHTEAFFVYELNDIKEALAQQVQSAKASFAADTLERRPETLSTLQEVPQGLQDSMPASSEFLPQSSEGDSICLRCP